MEERGRLKPVDRNEFEVIQSIEDIDLVGLSFEEMKKLCFDLGRRACLDGEVGAAAYSKSLESVLSQIQVDERNRIRLLELWNEGWGEMLNEIHNKGMDRGTERNNGESSIFNKMKNAQKRSEELRNVEREKQKENNSVER